MNEIIITTGSGSTMKTHRFGPLVWRTSKERRKAKHQRRDKCNSGDSGIHVELDNDEEGQAAEASTVETRNVNVRRTNSAKTSKLSIAREAASNGHRERVEETDSGHPSLDRSVKVRSLSQPSDLNRLPDQLNDTDSDSVSEGEWCDLLTTDHCRDYYYYYECLSVCPMGSIVLIRALPSLPPLDDHEEDEEDEPAVLAEVVFPFQPGGPQELALPKGALVEVLKRDGGPWWWGRIKNAPGVIDSEVELSQDRHGWFPKDFVRIIHQSSPPITSNSVVVVVNQATDVDTPSTSTTIGDRMDSSCATTEVPPLLSSASSELMRENVVRELLETEINYVKLLSSLCSG